MINSLISKYGKTITINGVDVKAYIDEQKENIFRKKEFGNMLSVIMTIEKVGLTDDIVIDNKHYRFLALSEAPRKFDNVVYYETIIYKDEFLDAVLKVQTNKQYNSETGETTFEETEKQIRVYVDENKTQTMKANNLIEQDSLIMLVMVDDINIQNAILFNNKVYTVLNIKKHIFKDVILFYEVEVC